MHALRLRKSFGNSVLSLAPMLALLVATCCRTTTSAQHPSVNDLAYATVTNDKGRQATLHLDLWLNKSDTGEAPLVIWIHGGAWLAGSYNSPPPPLRLLLKSGYAVASVQYRLSKTATFPAQIHDVKGAVRYLRAHADKYHLDSARFAAWGSSAGGHLAALLATSGGVAEAEGNSGGNLDVSSRIQAAVDYFGPTDLLNMNADVTTRPRSVLDHDAPDAPESQLIGFDAEGQGIGVLRNNLSNPDPPFPEKAALVRLANPIEHVSADDPPVFIAHGTRDNLVPRNQSVRLADALQVKGISHVLRIVEGAGHGFGPQSETVDAEAIAFLTKHLETEE